MKTDLRLTDTNAASDSKGRTWGLEGNLFWYLIGGIGAGITAFFLMVVVVRAAVFTSFVVSVMPVLLCLAYIFGLRQGNRPGYDRDSVEFWLTGRGFQPGRTDTTRHPFSDD